MNIWQFMSDHPFLTIFLAYIGLSVVSVVGSLFTATALEVMALRGRK